MANISLETEQRNPLQWLRRSVGEEYIIHTEEEYIRYFRALIKIEGIIYSENKKRKIWRDIKSACVILIIYALPLWILVTMICAKAYFTSLCSIPLFLFASALAIAVWEDRKYKPFTIFDYIEGANLDIQKPVAYVVKVVSHRYKCGDKKFPVDIRLGYCSGDRKPIVFYNSSYYNDDYKQVGILYQMMADVECGKDKYTDKCSTKITGDILEHLCYKVVERYDNEWKLRDYHKKVIPTQIDADAKLEFVGGGVYPQGGWLYHDLTSKEKNKKIEKILSILAIGSGAFACVFYLIVVILAECFGLSLL